MKYTLAILAICLTACGEPKLQDKAELQAPNTAVVHLDNKAVYVSYELDDSGLVAVLDAGTQDLSRNEHQRIVGLINGELR